MKPDTSLGRKSSHERTDRDYFSREKASPLKLQFVIGCVLTSIGILVTASGGSWDITNHLLNKPETFFSISHLVLYSGVGIAVVGSGIMFMGNRRLSREWKTRLPVSLVIVGISAVLVAAPFDYNWHLEFGLDGLLSPSHLVLTAGIFFASIGALLGFIKVQVGSFVQSASRELSYQNESKEMSGQRTGLPLSDNFLMVIGIIPIWLSATGILYMFSLPFSNTESFEFNPDPALAVVFTTISYPILITMVIFLSYRLNQRFGIISITGACFLLINTLTALVPNEFLVPTIPFYFLNIIPFVAADTILWFSKRKSLQYFAGAILGSTSFLVYYPLITYVYNELFDHKTVLPSLIAPRFSELVIDVYPMFVIPLIMAGILGVFLGRYFKIFGITKESKIYHHEKW